MQIIFVDTPGMHRPRTSLGTRLNAITDQQISGVDIVLFLIPANERIGPGDRHIIEHINSIKSSVTKLAVVTKIDTVSKEQLALQLVQVDQLNVFDTIIPVSSVKDNNLDQLLEVLRQKLPKGEFLYEPDQLTDESWQSMVSEFVRGAVLEELNDELPHSLLVRVNERVDNIIYLNLYIERTSQKGIIIGKGGERIRRIRQIATRLAREILGNDIVLNLQVKVAKDWQRNPKLLDRFGI
jgi:GTP-binding protein Era